MKPSCVCVLGGGGRGGLVLNEFTTDKLKLDYYSSVGKRITPGNARPCITSRVCSSLKFLRDSFAATKLITSWLRGSCLQSLNVSSSGR